jgi:hypothetical protein
MLRTTHAASQSLTESEDHHSNELEHDNRRAHPANASDRIRRHQELGYTYLRARDSGTQPRTPRPAAGRSEGHTLIFSFSRSVL